jgi:hypothetical protein
MLSCTAACPKHNQFIACTKIGIGVDLTARQNLKVTNSAQNRRLGRSRLRNSGGGPNFALNLLKSLPEFCAMKVLLALAILVPASAAGGAADASPSAYSDFEVVSVVPRNPNLKPFVMSILAREQRNTPHRNKWVRWTPTAGKD